MRVLVVEDEPKVAAALREGLESERYDVVVESSGEGAFFRANTERFGAVLLDLTLPGCDGLELLRTLRSRGINTPVMVLSARDGLGDRVVGLDSGADDYLVKPFAFEEMLARLRALLRRPRSLDTPRFDLADLSLDVIARTVNRGGQRIELTALEFDLLAYLARNSGTVVSRDTLARDLWSETARSTSLANVIDVHIARLRKKIDLGYEIKLIHTIRGVGFTLGEREW